MYWSKEECEEYVRYPSEGSAKELGSRIFFVAQYQISRNKEMKRFRQKMEQNNYDYAPARPYHSRQYYDLEADQVRPVDNDQYVRYQNVMLHVINILTEFPFALVTHPDRDCWRIVTPADLNTRVAREFLFNYYAEATMAVSEVIKEEYTANEMPEVYEGARPNGEAIDRWRRAVSQSMDLHPIEFMSLADMKEIVRDSRALLEKLDFSSKTQCKNTFDKVEKYRNKVMHGNRSVITTKDEVEELIRSLKESCELARNAGGEEPGLDITE